MSTVDVSFEVRCECLPRDYGYALFRALAEELDWLEEDAAAGVHPLHGTTASDGGLFLGKRARLMLRVTAARAGQALSLTGSRLALGGNTLHRAPAPALPRSKSPPHAPPPTSGRAPARPRPPPATPLPPKATTP